MRFPIFSLAGLTGLVAFVCAGAPRVAHGLEATDLLAYKVGDFIFRPHLGLDEQYNSNIFYREDPSEGSTNPPVVSDWVTQVRPGANVQLGRRDGNHVILDYTYEQLLYARNPDQNSGNNLVNLLHDLTWNRFHVEGIGRFAYLTDILGGMNNLGQKVDRAVWDIHEGLGYAVGEKTGVYGDFDFDAVNYAEGTSLYDVANITGTAGFQYRWTEKTRFFGEYFYGHSSVNPNLPPTPGDPSSVPGPPADFTGGFLGARGTFTAKLAGTIKAGYQSLWFEGDAESLNSPVVELGLDWKASERTWAVLSYSLRDSVSAQAPSQAYTASRVTLTLTQALSEDGKLSAGLNGFFEYDSYPDGGYYSGRIDRWLVASLYAEYRIQPWLSARLAYGFSGYRSNVAIDYNVSTVTLGFTVGY